jgi:hypothetical protein
MGNPNKNLRNPNKKKIKFWANPGNQNTKSGKSK